MFHLNSDPVAPEPALYDCCSAALCLLTEANQPGMEGTGMTRADWAATRGSEEDNDTLSANRSNISQHLLTDANQPGVEGTGMTRADWAATRGSEEDNDTLSANNRSNISQHLLTEAFQPR